MDVEAKRAERAERADRPDVPDEDPDPLDVESVRLQKIISSAVTRDDLQEIGQLITAAKQRIKGGATDDAHANMIVGVIEPALQRRWREIPARKK